MQHKILQGLSPMLTTDDLLLKYETLKSNFCHAGKRGIVVFCVMCTLMFPKRMFSLGV